MSAPPFDLAEALAHRGALLTGHFRLSSGRHSDRFIQKFRILEEPKLVEPIAVELAEHFRAEEPTVVVSAAVGGIVLGYEVARQLGVSAIFVEKEQGVPSLRRGFRLLSDDRVLIVEDVVTTGGSVREVLEVVHAHGACAIGVGLIVRRGDVHFDIPSHALLDLPIISYDPVECPKCKAGEPITDPGSRRG